MNRKCWSKLFSDDNFRRHDLRKIIRLKQNNKDKFQKRVESDDDESDQEKENNDASVKHDDKFENIDVVLTTYQSACSGEQASGLFFSNFKF